MRKLTVVLFALVISSLFLVNVSVSDFPPDPEGEYSPWGDLNDDGKIDIFDIVWLVSRYGTTGTPLNVTELLLELDTRMDALNASIIALQELVGGAIRIQSGTVDVATVSGGPSAGKAWIFFPNPNLFSQPPIVYAVAVLRVSDWADGPDRLHVGGVPSIEVTTMSQNFTITAKHKIGGKLMEGMNLEVNYIAIGTEDTSTTHPKHCAGIEMLTCGDYTPPPTIVNNYVKIVFPITFTNASNISLSASGLVFSASTGKGYPVKITVIEITATYAILACEGFNGSAWADLVQDDMVQISYTAVEA